MKLLSNKIKIEIQDDLKLLWEIKGCIFTYSPIDFNYSLIQLEDSNFFIIDKFKVYFFSCLRKVFSLIYEAEYEIQLYFFG